MASEIQLAHGVTGRTLYAVVRSATGTVWNGSAFETYAGANWTTYAVALTEQGSSGYYAGDFPAVAAGSYQVEVRWRAGGSPATTDAVVGSGSVEWDGSAVVPLSSRLASASYTAPPTAADNADTILGRNLAGGSNGGRTVRDSLRASRNKVAFDVPAAGQFTVFAEDDATPAWTGTYTRGANSLGPLTATDPG